MKNLSLVSSALVLALPSPAQAHEAPLRLSAWGRAGALVQVGQAPELVLGKRTEFRRSALVEWYVREAHGVEQGFDVACRPATRPNRPDAPPATRPVGRSGSAHRGLARGPRRSLPRRGWRRGVVPLPRPAGLGRHGAPARLLHAADRGRSDPRDRRCGRALPAGHRPLDLRDRGHAGAVDGHAQRRIRSQCRHRGRPRGGGDQSLLPGGLPGLGLGVRTGGHHLDRDRGVAGQRRVARRGSSAPAWHSTGTGSSSEPKTTTSEESAPAAAYVFELDPGGWQETAKLVADDGMFGDLFGRPGGRPREHDRRRCRARRHRIQDQRRLRVRLRANGGHLEPGPEAGCEPLRIQPVVRRSRGPRGGARWRSGPISTAWGASSRRAPCSSSSTRRGFGPRKTGSSPIRPRSWRCSDRGSISAATGSSPRRGRDSVVNNSQQEEGAAYVFKRSGSTWTQEAELRSPNPIFKGRLRHGARPSTATGS